MIKETGKNLSVLIMTEVGMDWQTFATWYSFYKNLPESNIVINCIRNGMTTDILFQWTRRLKVPILFSQPLSDKKDHYLNKLGSIKNIFDSKIITEDLLVVEPYIMSLDLLDKNKLNAINNQEKIIDPYVWFLKNPNIDEAIENYMLYEEKFSLNEQPICYEAKDIVFHSSLVSYKKGCGKWIHTSKGCPFSSAGGLHTINMTPSEHKVIKLWDRMISLYYATT